MFSLEIGEVLNKAWDLAKKNALVLILLNILLIVVVCGVSMATMPAEFWDNYMKAVNGSQKALTEIQKMSGEINIVQNLIVSLVSAFVATAMSVVYLRVVRGKDKTASIGSMFNVPAPMFLKAMAISFLFTYCNSLLSIGLAQIGLGVGLGLLIRAVIYVVYVRFMFASCVAIDDENVSFVDTFTTSWEITKNNWVSIILVLILSVLIGVIGAVCCCVGILFTMVITYFMNCVMYVALKDQKNPTMFDAVEELTSSKE